MVRRNLVVMTVLTVGVMAAAAYLSVAQPSGKSPDQGRIDHLLRRLADDQPDIHLEAAQKLRAMGPVVVEPLRAAAKSKDIGLSVRATRLLEAMGAANAQGDAAKPASEGSRRPGA